MIGKNAELELERNIYRLNNLGVARLITFSIQP